MKTTTILLAVFVALTIIFASLSAFESSRESARTETINSSTTLTMVQSSMITISQTKTFTTSVTATTTYTSTQTTTANLCPMPYPKTIYNVSRLPNGTTISTLKFPVLLLTPGTFGFVCIKYSNLYPSQPFDGNVGIWVVPGTPTGVTGAANVTTLSVHGNNTQTVLYVLAAGYGVRGTYGVAATQFCVGLPFAVGYTASDLRPANFSWFFRGASCPPQFLKPQITGYGNMNVTILGYVRRISG